MKQVIEILREELELAQKEKQDMYDRAEICTQRAKEAYAKAEQINKAINTLQSVQNLAVKEN